MRDLKPAWSRRAIGRVLAGAALATREQAQADGPRSWPTIPHLDADAERRYRADAQVLLLSIPLLHRAAVGGGSLVWRESAQPNGDTLRLLEFFGYSDPRRAAGLNRLGLIRELVRLSGNRVSEAFYFGLMTSSPEDSAEDARHALHSTAAQAAYSAIEGRIALGNAATAGAHFVAPAKFSAAQRGELEALGSQALQSAGLIDARFDSHAGMPAPFLEALAELLCAPDRNQGRYLYAGRLYRLWLHRSPDSKATEYFRGRRLATANVIRVSGKLCCESGGREREFRLWVEEGARPLPLRIEYQAKSYLRLTFEAEA